MTKQPNIVLVTIDSLRADKTGITDGESFTPNIDKIASDSISYENAIAPGPSTYESMPSIWTGELMGEVTADEDSTLEQMSRRKDTHLHQSTFPEKLNDLGYTCGAFTANPHTSRGTGFSRGFDDYEDFLDGETNPFWNWLGKRPLLSKLKHLVTVAKRDRVAQPWVTYKSDIVSWIQRASEPYFLWVFILEPHTPYLPRARHRRSSWVEMVLNNVRYWSGTDGLLSPDPTAMMEIYEDAIRDADEFVGWLSDTTAPDTSLVIHADHGEGFGPIDHGEWGHKGTFYEENIHVPLVVQHDDFDRSISKPICLTAIYDLILGMATDNFIPSGSAAEYTLSRTFRPSQMALRTNTRKYWASVGYGEILEDIEIEIGEEGEQEVNYRSNFSVYAEQLVQSRLTHESETRLIREAAREIDDRS